MDLLLSYVRRAGYNGNALRRPSSRRLDVMSTSQSPLLPSSSSTVPPCGLSAGTKSTYNSASKPKSKQKILMQFENPVPKITIPQDIKKFRLTGSFAEYTRAHKELRLQTPLTMVFDSPTTCVNYLDGLEPYIKARATSHAL